MIRPAESGIQESEVNSLVNSKLVSSTYTDTGTSGTGAKTTTSVTVTPTGNTSRVVLGNKVEITYNSSFNITTGGWVTPTQKVINTTGTGTIDKLVGDMNQMNLTGGNVSAAVGYEPVITTIGANTLISGYAGYYFPNLAGVANIGNITSFAAFSNDEPRAMVRSAGPFLNGDLRELSPSNNIGLINGRYYSAPAKSMTTSVMAANTIYVTYVHVPQRTTITRLGCEVTVAATGNLRIGLYKVANGALTTIIAQTSDISSTPLGIKEGTVSAQVDSGVYAIVAVFSATPTIRWHEINSHSMMGAATSSGYSEQAYITPFTYGALPTTANILPTFAANTIEPHLWFRVGV